MFLIDIEIQSEKIAPEDTEKLLEGHRAWFGKHFEAGDFLLLGPYKDREWAGLILAQADSKAQIEEIISEDSYYPDRAVYTISEFQANAISEKIQEYNGK